MTKLWANSGDSHFLEPADLWRSSLPPDVAERLPRTERDPGGQFETVHIDGQAFRRERPNPKLQEFREASHRAPGARNVKARLVDLDEEGIWASSCSRRSVCGMARSGIRRSCARRSA